VRLALLACLALTACTGLAGESVAPLPAAAQPRSLLAELPSLRQQNGFAAPEQRIVRTSEELAAAWQQLTARGRAQLPVPAVDFSREVVVLVALGLKPSTGHSVQIDAIRSSGANTTVVAHAVTPARDCIAGSAITYPLDLAIVPRLPGEMTIALETAVQSCNVQIP
jgi:hypothetical protein